MSRSLSVKFVATILPIILVVFVLFVGVYEWNAYKQARAELRQRLETMAASQSIILAESISQRDLENLRLMLASIISDRDLIGVAVYDAHDTPLDTFGILTPTSPDLAKSITVNYADDGGIRQVGKLRLVMTDERILEELRKHIWYDTLLGLALLVSGLLAALLVHRRIVVRPLGMLLDAIDETQGGAGRRVEWHSVDEIGRLIQSYNHMQERLEQYERQFQAQQTQLEQRVEERTHDLEQARRLAVEASRVKSKFLSSMSHEFRTPMNAIIGFTQVLLMSSDVAGNPRVQDRLGKIDESAKALMTLLDEIMEFARLESAEDDLHLEDVAPLDIIHESVAMATPLAEARRVTIAVEDNAEQTGAARVDAFKFRKALFHVLTNAIKYNNPGGDVSIACTRDGDSICIAVTDNGPGIPAHRAADIFEPFNRLGREAGNIGGSGIGLTMTRRFLESMSGGISFKSTPGQGTTFRINVPSAG